MPDQRVRGRFVLARSSPFSYECRGCGRCCRGKVIRLNPYEVARLAEFLGTSTTEVLARWTSEGGATLARHDDGACVFLGASGCSVHAARPLVCRLYPLGRRLDPDGTERFAELEPHPQTEGVYGKDGAVEDFLRSQDVARHLAAADRYVAVMKTLLVALAGRSDTDQVHEEAAEVLRRPPMPSDESLLDMDAVVAVWCARHGAPVPHDVEAKTEIHLRALEEFVAVTT
jgi:Fe-S-cluster containining protein